MNLYSLHLSKLHCLFNLSLTSTVTKPHSNKYKFTNMNDSDIASHRFFFNQFASKLSIMNKFSRKYLLILKISLYQSFLIPIPKLLQLKFWITNTFIRISILTTSSLNHLIATVPVHNSHIIRLARLLPVISILSITLPCQMCYSKVWNIVSLNQSIGNTTFKFVVLTTYLIRFEDMFFNRLSGF